MVSVFITIVCAAIAGFFLASGQPLWFGIFLAVAIVPLIWDLHVLYRNHEEEMKKLRRPKSKK